MPRKRSTNARTPRRTVSRISNSRIELEVDVSDTAVVEESDNTKPQEQTISESTTADQKKSLRSHLETTVTTVLKLFTLALLAGNAVLFVHNIQAMYASQEQLGILHAITVSWVITGLKPLVNAVQFALYFFKAEHHRRVLERLQAVDDQFFVLTGHRVHGVQDANIFMIRLTTWSLLFSFVFRIVDIGAQGFEGLLAHWLNAISPLLVPLLTAWNVIPLGYFFILHRIVRHWFDDLSRQLKADKFLQNRSLSEYFRYYKLLTDVLTEIRDLFNFWIAFSLSWALMCLCLAIFFVTQAPIFADAPEEFEMSAEDEIAFRIAIAFNLSWSLIQILVAIGFILVISISGIKTNETATWIMTTVLDCDPRNEDQCDIATVCLSNLSSATQFYFQLNKFSLLINTQCNWGITLCRSFPIQRSTLITMVSLIATYSMLLMKLQSSQEKSVGKKWIINDSEFGGNDEVTPLGE